MSAKGNRVAQVVMPVHQLPEQKTLLVTPHHFQHHRLNLAQLPLQRLRRLATLGLRYSGSCPDRLTRAFVRKLQATFAFQPLEKLPALPRFQLSGRPLPIQQLAHRSRQFHPAQLSTNSWIKLSSDELNRLPLKFAPLVPISLLATTTVANAGTNVQQKVTPLRVHNQSKFRYPLTNLTTSDRWTVRSLRKWAILAVPKEPHPNYFEVMGLGARVGRVISKSEDGQAAPAVAVLTYDYWHRLFGADPDVVGRTVTINNRSVEIIGVAEPAPPYPAETDIYVNMVASPHHLDASMTHDRLHRMTEVFARLSPDASVASASAEVEAITRRLHEEHPEAYGEQHGYQVSLVPLRDQLAANARPTMFMLLGVAAFVLLIACANVANLTLARVMRRYDEWTLRVSLGASTWTIRRQLLIENIVPSIAGAALGVLLTIAGVDLLAAYIARYSARASEITVDTTVLCVALGVALASACLFALLPRLPGTVSGSLGWLSGTRSTTGASGRRIQRLLVVSQVGVSFVLLLGAGLLLETLKNLQEDDGGVALEEVLAMNVPVDYGTRTGSELRTYFQTMVERVTALPGVRSAAVGSMMPLKEAPSGVWAAMAALEFEIEGQPTEPGAPPPRAGLRAVSPDYFRTLGMTLIRGRSFNAADEPDAAKVVVVNQALADHYFPDREAVGQRIGWRSEMAQYIGEDYRMIVGVVSDAKDYGVAADVPHVVFNPVTQFTIVSSLFVRTPQPEMVVRSILSEIRELNPEQPIEDVATLAEIRTESISAQRLNATLVGVFAFLALSVAAVGVAGVLAWGQPADARVRCPCGPRCRSVSPHAGRPQRRRAARSFRTCYRAHGIALPRPAHFRAAP